MSSTNCLAASLALAGLFAGCGQPQAPAPVAVAEQSSAEALGGFSKIPDDPIARIVFDFLDAVRQGKNESKQYLTPLALQLIEKNDFTFAPPASPTAKFAVGEVIPGELPSEAAVLTVWSDVDPDGATHEEEIIWGLKQVDGQWRIAGMGFQPDADKEDLMMISFEVPEDLQRAVPGAPSKPGTAPLPTDKVATDPFQKTEVR